MTTTVEKSVTNYIERFSPRTKGLDFDFRYDDIMISVEDDFTFVDSFLAFLLVHTLDTPLQTQTHTQACGCWSTTATTARLCVRLRLWRCVWISRTSQGPSRTFADLSRTSRGPLADLRGPSRTFADLSRTSRGPSRTSCGRGAFKVSFRCV